MASLIFNVGIMGAGKTTDLIETYNTLTNNNKMVIVAKAVKAPYKGLEAVETRTGNKLPCLQIKQDFDIAHNLKEHTFDYLLIDEAQFLTHAQIKQIIYLVDKLDINVYCYGIRTDAFGNLFASSKILFKIADKINFFQANCQKCSIKVGVYNARLVNNEIALNGKQYHTNKEDYVNLCRKCRENNTKRIGGVSTNPRLKS